MIRHNHLWERIISFENLLLASRKAQRGKRFRGNVLEFNDRLEQNLLTLKRELCDRTYQPGKYRTFEILDPKPRMISAAPYRDRVVHHALCNVIVESIERTFISDSYANRTGFGTHKALRKYTKYCRSSQYILQCDVQKYFPNIDHEILKSQIERKIKCNHTLWLTYLIIDNSNPQDSMYDHFRDDHLLTPLVRRKGLPIGNLTSQFLANVYLNGFDHFIKENLKAKKYLRYVDDFALFSDDREFLVQARVAIEDYLSTLRLKIHPIKSQITKTKYGASFVGFRVMSDRIRVRNDNLRRGRVKLRSLLKRHARGQVSEKIVAAGLNSWKAHLDHGDTWRLQRAIFDNLEVGSAD